MRRLLLSTTAIVTVVAAYVLAPAQADAHAAVSHQQAFSATVLDYTSGNFATTELEIPAFNSTQAYLGPNGLGSVLVFQSLKAKYGGSAHFTNRTSAAGGGSVTPSSASTAATVSVKTPLKITGGPSVLQGNAVLTVTASDSGLVFTYNQPAALSGSDSTSKGPTTFNDVADWQLPGGGTLIADLTTTTTAQNPPSGLLVNAVPTLSYALTGVYNYTTTSGPIPEPATVLMLGSGILALGAARRRRPRKG
jgi:hypothetical protein